MGVDFAIICSLVRPGRPRYPVLVHRAATLLHASSGRRLAMTPLRFANPSPPSGWIEDFHLQAVDHARCANDAATISRFSASGHDRLRFPVPFVPITEFVDTACPHNKNDHIRLRETMRFGKAVLGGGRRGK